MDNSKCLCIGAYTGDFPPTCVNTWTVEHPDRNANSKTVCKVMQDKWNSARDARQAAYDKTRLLSES